MKFVKWLFRQRWEYSANGLHRTHVETGRVQHLDGDDWGSFWLDGEGAA